MLELVVSFRHFNFARCNTSSIATCPLESLLRKAAKYEFSAAQYTGRHVSALQQKQSLSIMFEHVHACLDMFNLTRLA